MVVGGVIRSHVERVSRHPPPLALALSQAFVCFGGVLDGVLVVLDAVLVYFPFGRTTHVRARTQPVACAKLKVSHRAGHSGVYMCGHRLFYC